MLRGRMWNGAAAWVAAACLSTAGCTEQQWQEWQARQSAGRQTDRQPIRRTKPAANVEPARSKPAPATAAQDGQADPAGEAVEQYARNVETSYQPWRQGNDLNAKLARQRDPNRRERTASAANAFSANIDGADAGVHDRPPEGRPDSFDTRHAVRIDPDSAGSPSAPMSPKNDQRGRPTPFKSDDPQKASAGFGSADKPAKVVSERDRRPAPSPPVPPEEDEDAQDSSEAETPPAPMVHSQGAAKIGQPATVGSTPSLSADEDKRTTAKPPVIEEVTVSAAPDAPPAAAPPAGSSLAVNTSSATVPTDTLKARIAALRKAVEDNPDELEAQYRLRMLYLVEGKDELALASTPGMNADLQEIVLAQIRAFQAARSAPERDPALWANRQLDALDSLAKVMRAKADLQVPRVVICSRIDGFGTYTPIDPPTFSAGEQSEVVLYVEVDNYRSELTPSGKYRTALSLVLRVYSAEGREVFSLPPEKIEDVTRGPRRDFFVSWKVIVPKALPVGDYVLKVEVEDVVAGKINGNSARFKVAPRASVARPSALSQ